VRENVPTAVPVLHKRPTRLTLASRDRRLLAVAEISMVVYLLAVGVKTAKLDERIPAAR